MAIDGVKIIDSDDGYDIYNYVVESYKDGISADKIIADMLADEKNYCTNGFYTEIYWTSLAYSLWEIGHLSKEIKSKALEVIEKGVDKFWLEIDSKALKQRQKVLEKLAIQLQSENLKPIKVPKLKTKRTPHFNTGDILVLKFENEYGICFISSVDKSPRKIEYHLACTRLLQTSQPTINDFINSKIACGKMNTKFSLKTDCWFNHKELSELSPHMTKIGTVKLKNYTLGVLSPASKLDDIYKEIKRDIKIWNVKLKNVSEIIQEIYEVK